MMAKTETVVESVFTYKNTFFCIEKRGDGCRYLVAEFDEKMSLGLFYDLLEVRRGCDDLFAKLNAKMRDKFPEGSRY